MSLGGLLPMPPSLPSLSSPLSFLAFDFGTRRIGVATGNTVTERATPLKTLAGEGDRKFDAIGALIREWRPDALVVGVPFHPDGAPHENTARAQRFARQLHGRFGLAVHEVDERYSTTEADARGASDLDAASAAILLDQFFAERLVERLADQASASRVLAPNPTSE